MKVFLDSNVYVAEALLGRAAERLIRATVEARWRIYTSHYELEELGRVIERLGSRDVWRFFRSDESENGRRFLILPHRVTRSKAIRGTVRLFKPRCLAAPIISSRTIGTSST
jgi:predicted nucleic acid-binding protein